MCVVCNCTLLKLLVNILNVLSMLVMGLKKMDRGGWGELYPVLFGFLEFCLTLRSPLSG